MDHAGLPALVEAIRHLHGCGAMHIETVHVHEMVPSTGQTVWKGDVETFSLLGHPTATRAYAWSEATTGIKRRFFAVLHAGLVTSAQAAVQASILADTRPKTHAN